MYMFLNRLTGTQIGFTAMRLFVVDRPTILTVSSVEVDRHACEIMRLLGQC